MFGQNFFFFFSSGLTVSALRVIKDLAVGGYLAPDRTITLEFLNRGLVARRGAPGGVDSNGIRRGSLFHLGLELYDNGDGISQILVNFKELISRAHAPYLERVKNLFLGK